MFFSHVSCVKDRTVRGYEDSKQKKTAGIVGNLLHYWVGGVGWGWGQIFYTLIVECIVC